MAEILCSTGALIVKPNGRIYRLLETLSKQINCKRQIAPTFDLAGA